MAAALPEIAGDLGGVSLLPWVIAGYLFLSGVSTVVAGALVDSVGAHVMFRWAVVIFTAAGVAAAFAPSMEFMVAARLVQGAGAGLVFAVGLAAVGLIFPPHLVSRAYAANATVWGVMGVAGPAIAAFMLTVLSWRWIFLVNLPLGLLSLIAGWRAMPGPAAAGERRRVDVPGTLLVTVMTLSILMAVDSLDLSSAAWLAAGGVAAAAYLWHASRSERPVLKVKHLLQQPYSTLALGVGLLLCGVIAAHAYLPVYVQGGRGGSPALTAWSVLFLTLGWTLGANVSGRLLDRVSETRVIATGVGVAIPALYAVWAAAAFAAPVAVVFAAYLVAGLGVGSSTNATLTLLRAVTPDAELGRATSAHQFIRTQSFSLGSAAGGAVLLLVISQAIPDVDMVQQLLAGADVTAAGVAGALADGFATAALVGAMIATLAIVPVVALRRHFATARGRRSESLRETRP